MQTITPAQYRAIVDRAWDAYDDGNDAQSIVDIVLQALDVTTDR